MPEGWVDGAKQEAEAKPFDGPGSALTYSRLGGPSMVIPYRERGRVLPNEAGLAALKQWVESAPNLGEKSARALHVKSLHTKRGLGAKTLGFFWLDVPFRAAGASVRAGYQPHRTCPICVTLAQAGLSPRGKRLSSSVPASPSELPGSQDESIEEEVMEGHDSEQLHIRRISYPLATEVETPEGNLVAVLGCDDNVQWMSSDGGLVEPSDGARFARLRVSFMSSGSPHDVELIAGAFLLELDGGEVLHPLLENYSEHELLSHNDQIAPEERIEGFVYYEVQTGVQLSHAAFDCSDEEGGEGLWLRWKLPGTASAA